ncbi:MAG: GAF domain-containing protein [Anaerolineae bacterium]
MDTDLTVNGKECALLSLPDDRPLDFEPFLAHIQDVFFRWSPDGFQFINPAVERMTGYRPQDFYEDASLLKVVVCQDDLAVVQDALQSALAGRETGQPISIRWRHKDGSLVWVELLLSTVWNDLGQGVAVDALVRIDNTQLIKRERRQRQISDTMLQISMVLAKSLHLDQTLSDILEQLERLIPFDSATIYLVSDEDKKLRMVAAQGIPDVKVTMAASREVDRFPLDEEVLTTARPVIVGDVQEDPRWRRLKGTGYIRSYMGVPLLVRGKAIGLVTIDRRVPDSFTEADAQVVTVFAQQAAVALENARLFEQEHEQREISETLREISAVLAGSLDLDETLAHILEQLERLIPFDSATIYLVSDEDKKLRMVAAQGIPDVKVTMAASREVDRFPLDEEVLTTARPVIVGDVQEDPRWRRLKGTGYIRSYMGVPLLVRGKAIGLVTIDRRVPDSFSESNAQLAAVFARHAAVAIENARLFSEVKMQQRHLRRLSSQVVAAQEEERRRISRELHDEMGQALTAIKLNLQMVAASLPPENTVLAERLDEVIELSASALQEVRRLAMDLRPSMLDDLGLVPALHWYVDSFKKRTHIATEVRLPENLSRLPPDVETTLYRVVQEALTNVSRHAKASCVSLDLSLKESGLKLAIFDDGQGFDAGDSINSDSIGVGIASMKERVDNLGGAFAISSKSGRGTKITVSIPARVALAPDVGP